MGKSLLERLAEASKGGGADDAGPERKKLRERFNRWESEAKSDEDCGLLNKLFDELEGGK